MLNVRDIPRYEALGEYAKQFPNIDPVASEAFLVLLHTGNRISQLAEAHLQKQGISHARFVVLALLKKSPEFTLPASELAKRIGVTKQTLTSLIDGVEASGYVTRGDHCDDRRVCMLSLTPKGRKFMETVLPGVYDAQKQVMSALSKTEQKELAKLLRTLWTSMEPETTTE